MLLLFVSRRRCLEANYPWTLAINGAGALAKAAAVGRPARLSGAIAWWSLTGPPNGEAGVVGVNDRSRMGSLKVVCGTEGPQTAELSLDIDGDVRSTKAEGDGPVDATFAAIRQLFPHDAKLALFQVHAVTEGTDAQAEVTVRLEENGRTVNGQGADTDTLVAAARAYVNALNKLLTQREKSVSALSA